MHFLHCKAVHGKNLKERKCCHTTYTGWSWSSAALIYQPVVANKWHLLTVKVKQQPVIILLSSVFCLTSPWLEWGVNLNYRSVLIVIVKRQPFIRNERTLCCTVSTLCHCFYRFHLSIDLQCQWRKNPPYFIGLSLWIIYWVFTFHFRKLWASRFDLHIYWTFTYTGNILSTVCIAWPRDRCVPARLFAESQVSHQCPIQTWLLVDCILRTKVFYSYNSFTMDTYSSLTWVWADSENFLNNNLMIGLRNNLLIYTFIYSVLYYRCLILMIESLVNMGW